MPPTVPLNHDSGPADQRNGRSPVPLFHAYVSRRRPACLEHSNFFKVNAAGPARTQPRARAVSARRGAAPPDGGGPRPRGGGGGPGRWHASRRTGRAAPKSNYELFNCSNFNIRYWSWNYRGCWHQTCPPIDPRPRICVAPIPIARLPQGTPASLFLVTTSPSRDWVICAPAAFLGCGSRLSGSLSGIEP